MLNQTENVLTEILSQQNADAAQFEQLKKSNCDFTKEHEVDLLFLGPANGRKNIEKELTAKGFSLHPKQEKEGGLLLIKNMTLKLEEMQALTSEFVQLAMQNGCEYDGWGCVA